MEDHSLSPAFLPPGYKLGNTCVNANDIRNDDDLFEHLTSILSSKPYCAIFSFLSHLRIRDFLCCPEKYDLNEKFDHNEKTPVGVSIRENLEQINPSITCPKQRNTITYQNTR